jgi:hypothetical protein
MSSPKCSCQRPGLLRGRHSSQIYEIKRVALDSRQLLTFIRVLIYKTTKTQYCIASTMELALNLIWSLLSATLLVAAGIHLFSTASVGSGRRAMAVIALVCVVSFMFPVISMTDDISNSATMIEPAKLKIWLFPAAIACLFVSCVLLDFKSSANWQMLQLRGAIARPAQHSSWFKLSRRPPPYLA